MNLDTRRTREKAAVFPGVDYFENVSKFNFERAIYKLFCAVI